MQCLTSRFSNLHQASLTRLKALQPYTGPIGFSSMTADQLELPNPKTLKEYSRCLNQQGLEALKQESPDFKLAFHFFNHAKTLDETALAQTKKQFGEEDENYLQHLPDLARDFSNMASVYLKQKDYIKAENCLEKALDLYQKLAYENAVVIGEEYTPVYLVPVSIALQKLAQVYINCAMEEKANLVKPNSSLYELRSIKEPKKTLFKAEKGFLKRAQYLLQEAYYIRHSFLTDPRRIATEKVEKLIYQDQQTVKQLLTQVEDRILADKTLELNTQALRVVSFPEPSLKQWIQAITPLIKNYQSAGEYYQNLNQYYQHAHQTSPGQRTVQQVEHAIALLNAALKQDLEGFNKNPTMHVWGVIRDYINLGLVYQLGYELLRQHSDPEALDQADIFQNEAGEHYDIALSWLKQHDTKDQARNARVVLYNNYAGWLSSIKHYETANEFFEKAHEQLKTLNKQSGLYTVDQYTLYNNRKILMEMPDAAHLFKKLSQAQESLRLQAKMYDVPLHRKDGPMGLLSLHEEW